MNTAPKTTFCSPLRIAHEQPWGPVRGHSRRRLTA